MIVRVSVVLNFACMHAAQFPNSAACSSDTDKEKSTKNGDRGDKALAPLATAAAGNTADNAKQKLLLKDQAESTTPSSTTGKLLSKANESKSDKEKEDSAHSALHHAFMASLLGIRTVHQAWDSTCHLQSRVCLSMV